MGECETVPPLATACGFGGNCTQEMLANGTASGYVCVCDEGYYKMKEMDWYYERGTRPWQACNGVEGLGTGAWLMVLISAGTAMVQSFIYFGVKIKGGNKKASPQMWMFLIYSVLFVCVAAIRLCRVSPHS